MDADPDAPESIRGVKAECVEIDRWDDALARESIEGDLLTRTFWAVLPFWPDCCFDLFDRGFRCIPGETGRAEARSVSTLFA